VPTISTVKLKCLQEDLFHRLFFASEVPRVLSCAWNRDLSQCEADG